MNYFQKKAISKEWRIDLYEVLAERLENGMSLTDSLQKIYERAYGRKPKAATTQLLKAMIDSLESGDYMADALAPYVSESERMLIAAGETSGTLANDLGLVVKLIETTTELSSKIKKGISYPIGMIALVYVFLIWMGITLIPNFEKTSNPAHWTGLAAQMRDMAAFSTSSWSIIVPMIIAGICLWFYVRMPYQTGKLRAFMDNIPPWSFYKLSQGGGWLMAFASLVSAGMTHETALKQMSEHAKPWLKIRLEATIRRMGEGSNVGKALREAGYSFPSIKVIDALEDYSELSNFESALMKTADKWMKNGLKAMDQMMVILNILLAFLLVGSNVWLIYGVNAVTTVVTKGAHVPG